MALRGIMNAIIASVLLEAKVSFTRDTLFIVLISLVTFFSAVTDFPYAALDSEEMSTSARLTVALLDWVLLLAIFRRTVQRDLDDRQYFIQHPIDYKFHYLGKCLYLCMVFTFLELAVYTIYWLRNLYFANSLGTLVSVDSEYNLIHEWINSLFAAGLVLFIALFRPLHYVLLTAIVYGTFNAIESNSAVQSQIPTFSENYRTTLFWMPIPWILGIFMFEWKMTRPARTTKQFSLRYLGWLKKLRMHHWAPWVATLACVGIVLANAQAGLEATPLMKARDGLMRSLRQMEDQQRADTDYFSFKYATRNKWIADELSEYADNAWAGLHEEFGVPFPQNTAIDVFIKPSDEHLLGSTRGSFVVINSDAINNNAGDKQLTLYNTFRHELAHVLINRITDYQFFVRTGLLEGFFHEGLAELVERDWKTEDRGLIDEAALHYQIYDVELTKLLPQVERTGEYDYRLNYSLGYVFWSEFVKTYSRDKVRVFLAAFGTDQPDDSEYDGMPYLYRKANQVDIDLYKLFFRSRQVFEAAYQAMDHPIRSETLSLDSFKVARLEPEKLLIPYAFPESLSANCKFRKKDSTSTHSEKLVTWRYNGHTGGVCNIPATDNDDVQVLVRYRGNTTFRSQWINVPGL